MRPTLVMRSPYPPQASRRTAPPTVTPLTTEQHTRAVAHAKLAQFVLNKYFGRFKRTNRPLYHKLRAAAFYGLCLAAQRFSFRYKTFSTFAVPTIWGTIKKVFRTITEDERAGSTGDDAFDPDFKRKD